MSRYIGVCSGDVSCGAVQALNNAVLSLELAGLYVNLEKFHT